MMPLLRFVSSMTSPSQNQQAHDSSIQTAKRDNSFWCNLGYQHQTESRANWNYSFANCGLFIKLLLDPHLHPSCCFATWQSSHRGQQCNLCVANSTPNCLKPFIDYLTTMHMTSVSYVKNFFIIPIPDCNYSFANLTSVSFLQESAQQSFTAEY